MSLFFIGPSSILSHAGCSFSSLVGLWCRCSPRHYYHFSSAPPLFVAALYRCFCSLHHRFSLLFLVVVFASYATFRGCSWSVLDVTFRLHVSFIYAPSFCRRRRLSKPSLLAISWRKGTLHRVVNLTFFSMVFSF